MTRSHAVLRHDLLAIVRAGIAACDAERLTAVALIRERDTVPKSSTDVTAGYFVVAAGKAATGMAAAAAKHLGPSLRGGLIVSAAPAAGADRSSIPKLDTLIGGHPLPTSASEAAGRRAVDIAGQLPPSDTLLVLLSGGASALMAVPAHGVTLEDKRTTTDRLLRAGADIYALNTVRKHLSGIKGGRLAARAGGRCRSLVVSDVVGDDLSVIASGPTVPDASTFQDALDVMRRFGGLAVYPATVVARIESGAAGAVPETPKPADPRLAGATTTIIGSRRDAMAGAQTAASALGYHVVRVDEPVIGEARVAASAHLRAALATSTGGPRPLCVISSGETTVHVTGGGKGGRNQEFALAGALALGEPTRLHGSAPSAHGTPSPVVVASVGTDGIDGPTDAAGAIADDTTLARARGAGLRPAHFLADNNAYAFFELLGDLIHTGPTGTNVGDLQVILLA